MLGAAPEARLGRENTINRQRPQRRRPFWWRVTPLLLVLSCGRPVAAQPTSTEAYDDIREVIEELIEQEVAEAIARNLSCYSPHGYLRYFPRTLQAVYERNFSQLKSSLKEETAALAGNYVYESLRKGYSIPLSEFLPTVALEACSPEDEDCCTNQVVKRGGPEPYNRRLRGDSGTSQVPLGACEFTADSARTRMACYFGKASVAAAKGEQEEAATFLLQALIEPVIEQATGYLSSGTAKPGPWLKLRSLLTEETVVLAKSGAFRATGPLADVDVQSLDALLDVAKQPLSRILDNTGARPFTVVAGALQMSTFGLSGVTVRIERTGDSTIRLGDLQITHVLSRELTSPLAEAPGTAAAQGLLTDAGVVPRGVVQVTRTGGDFVLSFDAASKDPAQFTGNGLDGLSTLSGMLARQRQFQQLLPSSQDTGPSPERALLWSSLVGGLKWLNALVRQIYPLGLKNGSFSVRQFLENAADGELFALVCKTDDPGQPPAPDGDVPIKEVTACDLLSQLQGILDPTGDFHNILRAVSDGDTRAIAVETAGAVFSEHVREAVCCDAQNGARCKEDMDLYGRLAKTFVSYILMSRDDEDATLATRAAFKKAAADVVRKVGGGRGVDRPWVGRVLLPVPALHGSWSNGYVDAKRDGFRYSVSLDWITFPIKLWRTDLARWELNISLVDLLGPVSEVALRAPDYDYDRESALAWLLLQPRVEVQFASPMLSRHLAIAGGISLRGAAPFDATPHDNLPGPDWPYSSLLAAPAAVKDSYDFDDRLLRLFEAGIAIKYIL